MLKQLTFGLTLDDILFRCPLKGHIIDKQKGPVIIYEHQYIWHGKKKCCIQAQNNTSSCGLYTCHAALYHYVIQDQTFVSYNILQKYLG